MQFGELNLEGVAAAIKHVGELFQFTLRADAVIKKRILNEGLGACLMDEHANALDTTKLGADLEISMREGENGIKMTER